MISNNSICIIGGYDELSKSLFKVLRNKYKSTIFINLLNKAYHNKNLYNYNIFELKKILNLLKTQNVKDIIFLGKIIRPDLSRFKNDGIVENYIPIFFEAYKKGDGAVLDAVIGIFNEYNFNAVSPFKYCNNFSLSKADVLKNFKKDDVIDKSGLLVKKIKKNQSRIIDLPVVGPKTINLIKKANLKGIAIDIQNTLIYKKDEVLRLVKKYDLIIYNIS